MTSSTTGGAIQEVLLQRITHVEAKVGTPTSDLTRLRVAGIRVVTLGVTAHGRLALLVTRGTLSTNTLQVFSTVGAVLGRLIGRTGSVGAGTHLLRVALTRGRPTHRARRLVLALSRAATVVAGIADRVGGKFASGRVTARVPCTPGGTTTITVFTGLHNPVATLLTGDGDDASVVSQTIRLYRIASQRTTHVANRARREFGDAGPREGIHEVLRPGIARSLTQRTATRGTDGLLVGAHRRVAVVHRAERVAGFMREHLPLARLSAAHHVGTGDGLRRPARVGLTRGPVVAQLTQPRQTNFGTSVASGEQRPVGVGVTSGTTPGGEGVQALCYCRAIGARRVPRTARRRGGRTISFRHGQVPETQCDVKGGLI